MGKHGRREGRTAEILQWAQLRSLLQDLRKGEESGCGCTLCNHKDSRLSDQHILWQNPVIMAETEYRSETAVF